LAAIEEPAVALKLAVVAPAVTVTDAGTVSSVLLLASVTLAPPVGAALLKVTVQLEAELVFRLTGLHTTDEMMGTVTVPPAPETLSPLPAALTPIALLTVIADVTAWDPSVT
jgi:hypothetical protein